MSRQPIRLGPTSYMILGMIALRGPSTPYELKRAVGRSVGYFWHFPHSQLYDEPERLAVAGLLREEREEGGRHRRTYSLTSEGQRALEAWLRRPTGDAMEIQDLAQLQLFYSEYATRNDLIALADAQIAIYRQRLAEFDAIVRRNAGRAGIERRMAPLELGIRTYQAALDFWLALRANPPGDDREREPAGEAGPAP